jgi:hypothetical protein
MLASERPVAQGFVAFDNNSFATEERLANKGVLW